MERPCKPHLRGRILREAAPTKLVPISKTPLWFAAALGSGLVDETKISVVSILNLELKAKDLSHDRKMTRTTTQIYETFRTERFVSICKETRRPEALVGAGPDPLLQVRFRPLNKLIHILIDTGKIG